MVALLLIALLIVVNPKIALISAGLLIGIYILISLAVQAILRRNSEAGALHSMLRVKRVQEAIGGIRDILLDRSQPAFERAFEQSARIFRRVSTLSSFIAQAPRLLIEMIGMALIGAYAWSLAGSPGGLTAAIPMLGALALGAQRLLPLCQQATMAGRASSVRDKISSMWSICCRFPTTPRRRPRPRIPVQQLDRVRRVGFFLSHWRKGVA